MPVLDDVTVTAPATDAAPARVPARTGLGVRPAAIALWGVVGTMLGYGILQTVLKASALFVG